MQKKNILTLLNKKDFIYIQKIVLKNTIFRTFTEY